MFSHGGLGLRCLLDGQVGIDEVAWLRSPALAALRPTLIH
jgi:hypothetical protein